MTVLTDSHIFVGNTSNVATDVAMSGDASITNTGTVTVTIALDNLTDVITDYGNSNMFLGSGVGATITTGSENTGLGASCMTAIEDGNANTAFGFNALKNHVSNGGNVAIGSLALRSSTSSELNTAIGHGTLINVVSADQNVAIGTSAGSFTAGEGHVIIGADADVADSLLNSTAIGFQTTVLSGHSTAVGADAGVSSGITNATAIGYQANATSSNTVQIGNPSITGVYFGAAGTILGTDLALAGNPTTTTQSTGDSSTKIATTAFVQTVVGAITAGLDARPSCRVATTAALTATYSNGSSGVGATLTNSGTQAAISIDGKSLAVNDRVLVKNQATAAQNGIYTVTTLGSGSTNWVLTRATDFNSASNTGVVEGAFTVIEEGTSNNGTLWIETGAGPFTIGTTAITFTQLVVTSVADSAITFTDITTGNVSSTKHGFAPKSPADATQFLNGAATPAYAAVKDSDLSTSDVTTNNASTTKHGFLKKLDNTATHYMDGTGAWSTPAGSASATTFQYLTSGSSATYTTPANCRAIRVKMVGAGGGAGAAVTNNGSAGGDTIFNSVHAKAGGGGLAGGGGFTGGAGGTGGTGTANLRLDGGDGSPGMNLGLTHQVGASGGNSAFGGGAGGVPNPGAGNAGKANTGGGGGGGTEGTHGSGGGGGAGEYVELYISSPAASYTYTIGSGGAGGAAGGDAGGNGGSGLIIVEEFY
jgi:hypothetical protein